MDLLPMGELPTILRIQFANLTSKNEWGEKIHRGATVYPQMEYEMTAHGLRKAMIDHHTTPHNIGERARFYAKKGLVIVPMRAISLKQGFNHVEKRGGGQDGYRSVVARTLQEAEEFLHYEEKKDHVQIGKMLGYPVSSGEFFTEVWDKGYTDPIWQQAENTGKDVIKNQKDFQDTAGTSTKRLFRMRGIDDFWMLNSCFRYMNIRLLAHIPRSFDDQESLEVAKNYLQLARDLKIEGIEDVVDILKLPYEWDCLKGIAVINTPVFKLVVNSVPCYPNHVIQQESSFYPKEAPNGIKFPWNLNIGGCSV